MDRRESVESTLSPLPCIRSTALSSNNRTTMATNLHRLIKSNHLNNDYLSLDVRCLAVIRFNPQSRGPARLRYQQNSAPPQPRGNWRSTRRRRRQPTTPPRQDERRSRTNDGHDDEPSSSCPPRTTSSTSPYRDAQREMNTPRPLQNNLERYTHHHHHT